MYKEQARTAAGPGRAPHGCDGGAVGDEHYANIDPDELVDALDSAGFASSIVETNAAAGDVYAVAWVAVTWAWASASACIAAIMRAVSAS